jgi:alkylation response protein AidB-like acyl-CoA dehydrogenase
MFLWSNRPLGRQRWGHDRVDFRLDDDQLAVRDAVRSFCADRFDLERVATREGVAAADDTWSALAGIGVTAMLVEGSGFGMVEAAVVFEELGAALASGPLLWSALAAPVVPGAAEGTVRVTGVDLGGRADGPMVVAHGAESDLLLVLRGDRAELCPLGDQDGEPGSPIDPLTPMTVLPGVPAGDVVGGRAEVERIRRDGTILAAAMLVGGSQAVLDVAREYALGREQFGAPIGSFQAVKHMLADMYVRVEMARAATYAAAALAAGLGDGDADHAASAAKHLAGEAGTTNGRIAVQVLGGMGFTWDMLPHYFLKRSLVLDRAFGTSSAHAARLGAAVGAAVAAPAAAPAGH